MESATVEKPATEAATGSATLADLFPAAARKHGPKRAVLYKDDSGQWVSKTYTEVGEIVRKLSLGLIDLGIEKGDKVAILSNTRPEWTYFDFAALSAGATVVPIYQTNSPEECQYVLENSDAVAVDRRGRRAAREDPPGPRPVPEARARDPDDRRARATRSRSRTSPSAAPSGSEADWEQRYSSVGPDDICTFIYTSGTTGPPKGCVISHGNYRSMLDMVHEVNVLGDDEVTYLFLPLAHSFALLIQLGSFDLGATLAYWERDPLKILPNLAEVKPTYFPSVPRIFEKIYTAATSSVEKEGGAEEDGLRLGDRGRQEGAPARARRASARARCSRCSTGSPTSQVLSKIRGLFGGKLKLAVTGAAPINPEILEFFDAAGVLVLEGWGMTETSTASTIATPEDFKWGTIGKPFPGCELKIADDGEILVKGPNIFQGYYKNEEATRETLVDGWLHTGDIGEIDADGYLKITGRKKDIIITAGGKNITPANLEAEIKQHPLVSQCVVIGDRRPFLVALVTLDPEEAAKYAAEHGLAADPAALAANAEVKASIEAHVEKINEKFARVEQVKKIEILPSDLSQEGGELTPTMKVKRNVVADKYAGEVDALYAG